MRKGILFIVLAFVLSDVSAQVWTYNFGTTTGNHTSGIAVSPSFLPSPTAGGGTARVRVGSGSGSFNLENPGLATLGTNSELRAVSSSSGSVNKFSVYEYNPGKFFYNKFSIVLGDNSGSNSSTSGSWYFFQGAGARYSDNNTFATAEVFSGLRWVFGSSGDITTTYRLGSNWVALPGTPPEPISQGNVYSIEIYGNNSSIAMIYSRSGVQTLAVNTWDLWVNGILVGDDLSKALLADDSNIDSWMFYGESSTSNEANIFLDDFEYSNTLPVATPTNTINVDAVNSPPFVLTDCFDTETGTVDFSTTGIFNSGNIYTAQLSDASGSFALPTDIGNINSTATSGTIPITIPNGLPSSANYVIRVVSSDPATTGSASSSFQITQNGTCVSSASDYFRSKTTGLWSDVSTWETSSTGTVGTWIPATLTPDNTANTISIRNGHSLTANSAVTVDQVVIESGGTLINQMPASNALTIEDGTGDDIDIMSGGVYHVLSTQGYTNYQTINAGATFRIRNGGTIRLGDGSLFGGSSNHLLAATSTSYIWENNSVFEWNSSGAFATINITYFPDVNATTIPVFRTMQNIGSLGSTMDPTIINGVLESNGDMTWVGNPAKTFRNGIRGNGNVTNSSVGLFIIDGVTAELGGTGVITTTGGLQIGSVSGTGTLVSVTNDKTIVGYLSLWNSGTGAYLELGSNDLTVTLDIFGGTATSYIRTNGTGRLIQNNITGSRTFPIGHTSYNPLYISAGGNDLAARVDTGIAPPIAFPTYGINRTWFIQSLGSVANGVTVTYQFATADANPNIIPPEAMEILMYTDGMPTGAWSIIPGNDSIVPSGADPAWLITTTSDLDINNSTETPYCLGKKGGWILPLDCIVECRSQKQNNNGLISFEVNSCAEVNSFEIQRSSGGRPFTTIAEVPPDITKNRFSYTDADLQPGINLYRIKVNRLSGTIKYSNTNAIINDTKGWVITGVYPSPASDIVKLAISSAKAEQMQFRIYNTAGVLMRQWQENITAGTTIIETDVQQLAAGIYIFTVDEKGIKKSIRFIKN